MPVVSRAYGRGWGRALIQFCGTAEAVYRISCLSSLVRQALSAKKDFTIWSE